MGKHLQAAFAELEPDQFARLLGQSGSNSEAMTILEQIPDGLECDVVSRMSAESAERLLGSVNDGQLLRWLETAPVDAGRRILGRLEKDRSNRLVSSMRDRSKRRGLRRLTEYPPGSVGELVEARVVAVKADEPVDRIESLISSADAPHGVAVLVTGSDGRVLGVLDLMQLLQARGSGLTASDVCIRVEPLNAAASVASLQLPAEWSDLTALPVIDPSGQPIGYVTRTSLESSQDFRGEGSLFLESAVELSRRYWTFLFQVTELIFSRKPER